MFAIEILTLSILGIALGLSLYVLFLQVQAWQKRTGTADARSESTFPISYQVFTGTALNLPGLSNTFSPVRYEMCLN